jgi:hypothetical protein
VDFVIDTGQRSVILEQVHNTAIRSIPRVDDCCFAGFPAHRTRVTGLTTAHRIEHGAIDGYGIVDDCDDRCIALPEI